MRRDSRVSAGQRLEAVRMFAAGQGPRHTARRLGVGYDAVKAIYERWRLRGTEAIVRRPARTYTFETKREVVRRALAGETKAALAAAFGLASPQRVAEWLRIYRREGEDGLRPKPKGRPPTLAVPPEETELARLRRENERLGAEVAYLGKVRALTAPKRR